METEKIFTQSAKSKHLRRSQVLGRLWKNESPPGDDPNYLAPSRQSKTSFEDREVIASNTRNIAALAAKKRTQASSTSNSAPETIDEFAPGLTPNRLAQHNRLMGDGSYTNANLNLSEDSLSQNTSEKTSLHTDNSLPQLVGGEAKFRPKKVEAEERRTKGQDVSICVPLPIRINQALGIILLSYLWILFLFVTVSFF